MLHVKAAARTGTAINIARNIQTQKQHIKQEQQQQQQQKSNKNATTMFLCIQSIARRTTQTNPVQKRTLRTEGKQTHTHTHTLLAGKQTTIETPEEPPT